MNSAMTSAFGSSKQAEVKPAVAKPTDVVTPKKVANAPIIVDGVVVSREEYDAIWYTNWYRRKNGKRELKVSQKLMDDSRRWAKNMADRESMYHDTGVQENVAYGQRDSREVTATWYASSGHRNSMLSNTTHMGVAVCNSRSGRRYWCQRFNNQAQVK
jgi:uncharacterized protein YkwD